MTIWKAMLRIFVQQQVIHREFWLALLLNGVLPVVVPLLAWTALADSVDHLLIDGWTIHKFTQYYIVNFVIYSLSFTAIHSEMGSLIRTGQMNFWILRPLHFLQFAFSYSAAKFIVMLGFCIALGIGLQMLGVFTFVPSQLFIASLVLPLSILLLMLLNICIGTFAFWLIECDGMFAAVLLLLQFFGGLILPLDLFPDLIKPMSAILPLRFAFGMPSDAIVNLSYSQIAPILLGQCIWIVIVFTLTTILWRSGLRHYDAVGA